MASGQSDVGYTQSNARARTSFHPCPPVDSCPHCLRNMAAIPFSSSFRRSLSASLEPSSAYCKALSQSYGLGHRVLQEPCSTTLLCRCHLYPGGSFVALAGPECLAICPTYCSQIANRTQMVSLSTRVASLASFFPVAVFGVPSHSWQPP
jgi:hypothetical protein